jgi:hypothetical protein
MGAGLPLPVDETIHQGATWHRLYRWSPGGEPADLTGWAALLQIRGGYADTAPNVALSLTEADGIVLGADGSIEFEATAAATRALTRGSARRYDLELTAPDGTVIRFLMGRVTLSLEVSREVAAP